MVTHISVEPANLQNTIDLIPFHDGLFEIEAAVKYDALEVLLKFENIKIKVLFNIFCKDYGLNSNSNRNYPEIMGALFCKKFFKHKKIYNHLILNSDIQGHLSTRTARSIFFIKVCSAAKNYNLQNLNTLYENVNCPKFQSPFWVGLAMRDHLGDEESLDILYFFLNEGFSYSHSLYTNFKKRKYVREIFKNNPTVHSIFTNIIDRKEEKECIIL